MKRSDADYQAFYCEENIWRLAVAGGWGREAQVAIISNPGRRVALWSQRAGLAEDEGLVVWDYHVILIDRAPAARIWDLDTTMEFGVDAQDYLEATFRPVPPVFAPRFRLLDVAAYAGGFGSDRSHMRDGLGGYRSPPPPWDAPRGTALPLPELLDPAAVPQSPWKDLAELREVL